MKNIWNAIACSIVILTTVSCKDKEEGKETVLTGEAIVAVDESILPIMQDQVEIFQNAYKATINLRASSESEVVNALLKDSVQIVVLTRDLKETEMDVFKNRKVTPKVTKFAIDAIALIAHKSGNDTVIALADVVSFGVLPGVVMYKALETFGNQIYGITLPFEVKDTAP